MIELTKSSRVAYESLNKTEKENFMRLYDHRREDEPDMILSSYAAIKLPDMENIYLLKISDHLRAIIRISEDKIFVLEIVRNDSLRQIFSSLKQGESL
ncbi:hypothetical protein QUF80_13295 [Desulfococcaceae bacterium HSG8]|nr:hypothetical protein [Desulfococcaceae bacterium HSG8]